jgi:hypothetical protein
VRHRLLALPPGRSELRRNRDVVRQERSLRHSVSAVRALRRSIFPGCRIVDLIARDGRLGLHGTGAPYFRLHRVFHGARLR